MSEREDKIRELAYQNYLRGGTDALQNWLSAEKEYDREQLADLDNFPVLGNPVPVEPAGVWASTKQAPEEPEPTKERRVSFSGTAEILAKEVPESESQKELTLKPKKRRSFLRKPGR